MSTINEAATERARRMLDDVYTHGGSILFKAHAVELGAVHDIIADKWYQIVLDDEQQHCFVDEVGEFNYAGSFKSVVWEKCPTATLTCPF